MQDLRKAFGTTVAIDGISLTLARGQILALLGPSGCGKTTILRSVAGFVAPDGGSIRLDGREVTRLPPEDRGTGMVFQNYALFPHMTVAENVGFGLKMHRVPRPERTGRVAAALSLVQLAGMAGRYPAELSGGQQQRTALARAVAIRPSVLLLDEPFGALDENLRQTMQIELRKLQQQLGLTTVIVTHDQQEAMIVADLIAVIRAGRLEQLAPPATVYDRPATRFVAAFMGVENILDAKADGDAVRVGPYRLSLAGAAPEPRRSHAEVLAGGGPRSTHPGSAPGGIRDAGASFEAPLGGAPQDERGGGPSGAPLGVAVRAEAIGLHPPGAAGDWPGRVVFATNLGGKILYEVEVDGVGRLKAEQPRRVGAATFPVGEAVAVRIDPRSVTPLRY